MKPIVFASFLWFATVVVAGDKPYDFRTSGAYARLTAEERQGLEQVHRDLVLLWGALDMYADDHGDKLPASLDDLVPIYLEELPSDPFATAETAKAVPPGYAPSKKGKGYRLKKGSPGNRAWVISSVGLSGFPYLAERGNVGLYLCKGTWISGRNPG